MKTFKGKIERKEKSKWKKIAFNSMKWAKEGLMIVTTCTVMSTGVTNNIYGDEKMSGITQVKSSLTNVAVSKTEKDKKEEKNIQQNFFTSAFIGFNQFKCEDKTTCPPDIASKEVIDSFTTKNKEGEKVITVETLMKKIKQNPYLKGRVDFKIIEKNLSGIFGKKGINAEIIDMKTNNVKNAAFIYAVALSSINDTPKTKGIITRNNIGLTDDEITSISNLKESAILNSLEGELNKIIDEVTDPIDQQSRLDTNYTTVNISGHEITITDGRLGANAGHKIKSILGEELYSDGMYDVSTLEKIENTLDIINDELEENNDKTYQKRLEKDKENLEKLKSNYVNTFKMGFGGEIASTFDGDGYVVVLAANFGGKIGLNEPDITGYVGGSTTIGWAVGNTGFMYAGVGFGYDGSEIFSLSPSTKIGGGLSHKITDDAYITYTIAGLDYNLGIYQGTDQTYLKHTFTTSTGTKFTYFTPKSNTEFSTSMYLLFGTSVQKTDKETYVEIAPGIFIEQDFHYLSFSTGAQVDTKTGDVKTNFGVKANITNMIEARRNKKGKRLPSWFPNISLGVNFETDTRGMR
jgi:hypothetical protein